MCALHALRAQTHLGLSAVRWSEWFPPGDPPAPALIHTRHDSRPVVVDSSGVAAASTPHTPAARCDCLAGVLHAL